jgi:signal transduction histidine kinase/PAS domain-containing protein
MDRQLQSHLWGDCKAWPLRLGVLGVSKMRQFDPPDPSEGWSPITEFVRARSADILATWMRTARNRTAGKDFSESSLIAQVSPLLDWLARRDGPTADMKSLEALAAEWARDRMAEGLELREVLAHYAILRDSMMRMWGESAALRESWPGMIAIHRVIDAASAAAIAEYSALQDRRLEATDHVSLDTFESSTLNELLERLLLTFQETAPAVDSAAILLRDGDELRLHTIVGGDPKTTQDSRNYTVRIGEGFVGRIAAQKRPLTVRNAATDPLVLHPRIKAIGMRAAYGVPLMEGGDVTGVAVIASSTAWEFPRSDQTIFDAVARRAASAISYSRNREAVDNERARLAALLAQMPSGVILVDASGKITLYNNQAELIWRRTFKPSTRMDEYAWPVYHPDGRRFEYEEWPLVQAIRDGAFTLNQEMEIMRGDGSRATILVSAAPIRAANTQIIGGVCTLVDITEKRIIERQLKATADEAQRAEIFQKIVAEASLQLAEAFKEGTTVSSIIHLAVPQLADWCSVHELGDDGRMRLLEFAHVDPVKTSLLRELLERHPELAEPGPETREALKDQKPRIYPDLTEEIIREETISGEQKELARELGLVSLMILPLVARGRTIGAIRFASAESRRRFTPEDLVLAQELARRSAFAIENARLYDKARVAVKQREELMAIISHDLRNPLTVVSLSARQLPSATPSAVGKEAERILRAADRMQRLLRDLIDFAAIGSGQLAIERKAVDVRPIIAELVTASEKEARPAGIALAGEVEADLPKVSADSDRFIQILENLVSNALKVTQSGGTVTVRASRHGDQIRFSVADTGPGISREEIGHIFDRYYRGRYKRGQGLGLGLPIAKGLVERQGGRIWAESEPGKGSVFQFTLPLAA